MGWRQKVTIGMIVGFAVILGGWEIYVIVNQASGDTISEINLQKGGLIAFLFGYLIATPIGMLLGHLYWPQYRETQ